MKSFFIVLLLSLYISSFAQVIDWEKNYGGSADDQIEHMIHSFDGNLLAVATTKSTDKDLSFNRGSIDGFVFKVDRKGQILWSTNIGGKGLDNPLKVLEATDSNIYVIGYSNSSVIFPSYNHGGHDVWIVKLSSSGKVLKQKFFGGSGTDLGTGIVEGSAGNFYFSAITNSTNGDILSNHGSDDFWVCAIDRDLNLLWSKTYGGSASDRAYSISFQKKQLFVCGESRSSNGDVPINMGNGDAWILKLKETGNLISSRIYGGSADDQAIVIKPNQFGFAVVCSSQSSDGHFPNNLGLRDAWVFQLNNQLNVVWSKHFGGTKNDYLSDLFLDKNENLALLGATESSNGVVPGNLGLSDYWLVITNAQGQLLSSEIFGGSNFEYGKGITVIDGDLYLGGGTRSIDHDVSSNYGGTDGWILKLVKTPLSKTLTIPAYPPQIDPTPNPSITLFPNPAASYVNITTASSGGYQIINNQGNAIKFGQLGAGKTRIDLQLIPPGFYHIVVDLPTDKVVRTFTKFQ